MTAPNREYREKQKSILLDVTPPCRPTSKSRYACEKAALSTMGQPAASTFEARRCHTRPGHLRVLQRTERNIKVMSR